MANKSITLSTAGISTYEDEIILSRLQEYCYKMKIDLQAVSINDRLFMKFSGNEYQMSELEEYLKSKNKESK